MAASFYSVLVKFREMMLMGLMPQRYTFYHLYTTTMSHHHQCQLHCVTVTSDNTGVYCKHVLPSHLTHKHTVCCQVYAAPPPAHPPDGIVDPLTLGGQVPLEYLYVDDTNGGQGQYCSRM